MDSTVGFTRPEMYSEKLAGTTNPPSVRHAFCLLKTDAASWGKEWASPLLEKLQATVDKKKVRITAAEALEGVDEEGDVLVFPDFVRVKGVLKTEANITDFADRLQSTVPLALSEDCALLSRSQVMVCAHTKRDERCGHCGPLLVEAFETEKTKSGKIDVCEVRKCSHVGGHVYAGNVIVFRPSANAPAKDDASGGDWFGYVTPKDVPAFLGLCGLDSSIYPPHDVHKLWRGRFGVDEKDHGELCEKVSAACSSCTESVRDMEDGVAGWPSPTVRDAEAKKKFMSPKTVKSPPPTNPAPTTALAAAAAALVHSSKQARVVFILGAPGSGKGTQCSNLVRDYDLVHLSAGDLLRDERANPDSMDGQLIETYIREGKIVPVAITVRLLWTAMVKNMSNGHYNFLIDGFPRNQDNLDGWNAQIGVDKARVVGVIFLDCAESIVEARLLERGKTSGRIDDNIASIRKRFATYVNETMPIINIFAGRQMCWKIDSTRPKDPVYEDVKRVVNEFVIPKKRCVIFVLGGPGAGKGTQCSNLIRDFDCTHLSAGDLLRAERSDPDSKDGKLIESYIVEGKIVPVEITVNLLLKAMDKSGTRNFLIDGFPRNLDNVQGWNNVVGIDSETTKVAGVLFFDVAEDVMEKRLLERAVKDGANARSDDKIEVIKKRFKTFRDETMPIIEVYRQKNMVWCVTADRSVDVIYDEVRSIAEKVFLPKLSFPVSLEIKAAITPSTANQESSSVAKGAFPSAYSALDQAEDSTRNILLVVTAVAGLGLFAAYLMRNRE